MDKDQVLQAIKKNALSIGAGVFGIVCIVAIFFYVNPQIEDLEAKLKQSKATGDAIESLRTKQRTSLQLTPDDDDDPDMLTGFPTRVTIQNGQDIMSEVKANANNLLDTAVSANRRVPLDQPNFETAAEAWPLEDARSVNARDSWLRAYKYHINADNVFNDAEGTFPPNTLAGNVRATRPPTESSIEANIASNRSVMERDAPRVDGEVADPDALERDILKKERDIRTGMKYARALKSMMYLDNDAITVHSVAGVDSRPDPTEMWEAQTQVWVQETVTQNLLRANLNYLASQPDIPQSRYNLINAPVKHLIAIDFPSSFVGAAALSEKEAAPAGGGNTGGGNFFTPYGGVPGEFGPPPGFPGGYGNAASPRNPPAGGRNAGRGAATADEDAGPVELPVDAGTEWDRNYRYSSSGRPLHTPFFDVMQFNVTLRCEAESVPYVIQQLQSNSLLTVLNVFEMETVDPYVAETEGYVYGDGPIVELDLQCEILFL
ncbi:MAG: hypothetical protein AAGK78_00600, partial [Planctomycetota bacterium]